MFKFGIQRFADGDAVRSKDLQMAMTRVKSALDIVAQTAGNGFKSLAVAQVALIFTMFLSATVTQESTALAYFDFPEKLFLDQAGTTVVENFAWSAATYPGSTNPNLDGKTVLVLAVKGDKFFRLPSEIG